MQSDYGTMSSFRYLLYLAPADSFKLELSKISYLITHQVFISPHCTTFLKLAFAQHRITQHMTSTRSAIYYSTTELALVLADEDVSLRLPRLSVMRPGLKFVLHQCTNYQVWSSQAFPYREWLIFDHGVKRPDWPFWPWNCMVQNVSHGADNVPANFDGFSATFHCQLMGNILTTWPFNWHHRAMHARRWCGVIVIIHRHRHRSRGDKG